MIDLSINENAITVLSLTLVLGFLGGIIFIKIYEIGILFLFGAGTLSGRADHAFETVAVDLCHGRVRVLRTTLGGPLVVLIHGYAGTLDCYANPSRSNYVGQLNALGYDVLAFDLFGHGGSDSPDTKFSTELFACQLAEICLKLNIRDPFIIIAHSMGGAVAVSFTYRYPNLVQKLILLSPSIVDDAMEVRLRFALRVPIFREILSSLIIPTFGEGTNAKNPGLVRSCYRLLETRLANAGSWCSGRMKITEMLKEIAPTHHISLLWGEGDRVVPFELCKLLIPIIPKARLCVCKEADHMSWTDGTDDHVKLFFSQRVMDFVKTTDERMESQFSTTVEEYFAKPTISEEYQPLIY